MSDEGPYLTRVAGRRAWHIRDGKRRISTKEESRGAATRVLLRYIEEKKEKAAAGAEPVTVSQILDLWVEHKREKLERSGTWQKKWRYIVRKLKDQGGDSILEQVDRTWGRAYVSRRLKEGSGGPSVRQELSNLSAAWRMAHSEGLTSLQPVRFDLPAASPAHGAFLSKDEARRLLKACALPHLRLFVRIGLETGARPGAITDLEWSRVSLDEKPPRIDFRNELKEEAEKEGSGVRAGKRKRRVLVPISQGLCEELKAAKELSVTRYVIEKNGKRVKSLRRSFSVAVEAAGLPKDITPHIMRHSVITWSLQDGRSPYDVARFVGHSDTQMIMKRYGHHSPEKLRGLLESLNLEE